VLKLTNGFGAADVQAAFVREVKAAHPDNGGNGDVSGIVAAKNLLLLHLSGKTPCTQCNGRGNIPARFGASICSRCGGEGTV
jgi:DnaJ-class molecular chaperone